MGFWDFILPLILSWIDIIWGALKGFVDAAIRAIVNAIAWTINNTYKFFYNTYYHITKYITNINNIINKYITNVTKIITSWFAATWSNQLSFTNWIIRNIWGWLDSQWTSSNSLANWVKARIWGWLNVGWTSLTSFNNYIQSRLWGWLYSLWTSITTFTAWITLLIQTYIDISLYLFYNTIFIAIKAGLKTGGWIVTALAPHMKTMLDTFAVMYGESPGEMDDLYKEGEKPNWEEVDASNMKW